MNTISVSMVKRRGTRVIRGGETKGEEGLECEVCIDGIYLGHVSEFKCLGYVLDDSDTDKAECKRKVASGRSVAGAIRFLVNARSLQLEYTRVLYE